MLRSYARREGTGARKLLVLEARMLPLFEFLDQELVRCDELGIC
jgi:hypothetical protein